MEAIKILTKLSDQIKETYKTTADFENWATDNNNVEIMHNSVAYCIDYRVIWNRAVSCELSVMKPDMVEGRKTWFKCGIDPDLKQFIESAMSQLIPIWFDELLESEIQATNERIAQHRDEMAMLDTYQSLMNL
jgi:hypothetical protein